MLDRENCYTIEELHGECVTCAASAGIFCLDNQKCYLSSLADAENSEVSRGNFCSYNFVREYVFCGLEDDGPGCQENNNVIVDDTWWEAQKANDIYEEEIQHQMMVQESKFCSLQFTYQMSSKINTTKSGATPPNTLAILFVDQFSDNITFTIRNGFQELP